MKLTGSDISALYTEHSRSVLRFAMRRTLDAQVSVDLVGEAFAVAYEQRRKFRGSTDAELRSWLFGIAANLLSDYFRKGQIERRAMARLGVEPLAVDSDEIERIEQLSESSELRAAVAGALDELGSESREALRLRVIDELPYSEVARVMAVSEQVARARVSRGLRALREQIDSEFSNEVVESV